LFQELITWQHELLDELIVNLKSHYQFVIFGENGITNLMNIKRNILIATPLKGDVPKNYFVTSLQLAAQKLSDIKLDWILLDGPAVQMARNQLAAYAIEKNFHELIFWDKDVVAQTDGQNTTVSAIMRLISHDVDMVCGIYGTRSMDTHWHVQPLPGEQPGLDGLQKVKRCCIGFSKIKTSVFKKLIVDNPDRLAIMADPNHEPKVIPELFPMGIQGKNTAESRLSEVKAILGDQTLQDHAKLARIDRELGLTYDEKNLYAGEDYWFCDLVRASGFEVYLDTNLMMSHTGSANFPISTEELVKALNEPWRKDEIIAIKKKFAETKSPAPK
jgi:hypothetical protein